MGITVTATCDNCDEEVYTCEDVNKDIGKQVVADAEKAIAEHECETEDE